MQSMGFPLVNYINLEHFELSLRYLVIESKHLSEIRQIRQRISEKMINTNVHWCLFIAVSWPDAFYDIRKKNYHADICKNDDIFCTDINILIKRKFMKQRSHKMMDF